jgi:hypothetical protein
VHCSIWTYVGDPDDLIARYEAMVDEIPAGNMRFHACARTADGIVMFDTCPSKEVFDAFYSSPEAQALMERHGLDQPVDRVDFPVVRAYAGGQRVDVPAG